MSLDWEGQVLQLAKTERLAGRGERPHLRNIKATATGVGREESQLT